MKLIYRVFCVFLFIASSAQAANDQELYDPKPPADAAFVRFVNLEASTLTISGGGVAEKPVATHSASDFFVVKQGKQTFSYGSKSTDLDIEAGKYYTIAFADAKVTVVKDGVLSNPAKSMLYFYNFSGKEGLSLFAPKQKVAIFKDVKTDAGTSREINPLALELSVMQDGKDLAMLAPITLQRRTGYSIIVFADTTTVKAVVVENMVGK
jgi:hypothetical protein